MNEIEWYHGGDLATGIPKGTYLYVTDSRKFAAAHARDHLGGKVYRLRPTFHHLVVRHAADSEKPVILQSALREAGGALMVFEELPEG